MFKYAVEKVNSRRDILPYTKLTYDIQECPADDSFLAAKKGNDYFLCLFYIGVNTTQTIMWSLCVLLAHIHFPNDNFGARKFLLQSAYFVPCKCGHCQI